MNKTSKVESLNDMPLVELPHLSSVATIPAHSPYTHMLFARRSPHSRPTTSLSSMVWYWSHPRQSEDLTSRHLQWTKPHKQQQLNRDAQHAGHKSSMYEVGRLFRYGGRLDWRGCRMTRRSVSAKGRGFSYGRIRRILHHGTEDLAKRGVYLVSRYSF